MNHTPALASPAARHRIELRVDSRADAIPEVRRAVEQLATDCGFTPAATADLGLCVNEAMANVVRHVYHGAPGHLIAITAECLRARQCDEPSRNGNTSPAMRVTMRDWGSGVNPATLPPKPRDPLTPGGLGMICLRQLMDEVTFAPQPDGMLLTMTKTSRPASGAVADAVDDATRSRAMSQLSTGSELVPAARRDGDALVAELRGEIDLHNSTALRTALLDLLMKVEPKRLVLNLALVPYMDSSGIAVLVEMLGRLRRAGGKVFLTNLQQRVRSILEIARLDTIFVVTADETTALAR